MAIEITSGAVVYRKNTGKIEYLLLESSLKVTLKGTKPYKKLLNEKSKKKRNWYCQSTLVFTYILNMTCQMGTGSR